MVGNRLFFLGVLSQAMLRKDTNLQNVFLGIWERKLSASP